MKNQGNRNNVLYVVFYKLSDDKSYFQTNELEILLLLTI